MLRLFFAMFQIGRLLILAVEQTVSKYGAVNYSL